MLYNANLSYNNPNYLYNGTLIIKAQSLIDPIILNNITILYSLNEDYSNYTTIAVLSIDTSPNGILTLEVLDKDVSAILSAQVISIGTPGEVSIVS
jgi:hypothetical protein